MPRRLGSLAVLLASLGCASREDPPPQRLPLEVEFAGCIGARAGPVCEIAGGEIRLWIKAPAGASVRIDVDDRRSTEEARPVQDGAAVRVPVPPGSRAITITATRERASGSFRLPLVAPEVDPAFDAAEKRRKAGDLEAAERGFTARLEGADASRRARTLGKIARIRLAEGRPADAITILRAVVTLDRAAGRLSDEFRDRFALSFNLCEHERRFTEARAALEPLAALVASYPEGGAGLPYYRGVIAYKTGDLRGALRQLGEAEARDARLGLEEDRVNAIDVQVDVLHQLGRRAEALSRLEEVRAALADKASACRRADLATERGWFFLDAEEVGEPRGEDPIPLFEEALSLYRSACPKPPMIANVLTSLALAKLDRGDLSAALRRVDEARRAYPDAPAREAEWLDIEGRVALAKNDARRALDRFTRLHALSEQVILRDAMGQAALGRAEALEMLGRHEEAREAYEIAERQLDEQGLLVPLGEGKETFFGRGERRARRHIDFLVRRALPGAAAARRSRARMLASIRSEGRLGALTGSQRIVWEEAISSYRSGREALDAEAAADWKLPADKLAVAVASRKARDAKLRAAMEEALSSLGEPLLGAALAEPRRGEAFLVYHPIALGWAGFLVLPDRTETRQLPPIDPAAPAADLGRILLDPFRGALAGIDRIRVLPYGRLEQVDFHALPFDGAPLSQRFVVVYGVDLPARAVTAQGALARALVVADPRGDLPAARAEAEAVASLLSGRGVSVIRLSGVEATLAGVRDALEDPLVGLFHYAGHGVFEGRDGWESGLPLSAGGWISIADVMALKRAPAKVVLSGCETARTASLAPVAGLGLAQAFVLAGAREVVAASRPVDDALAGKLMREVHRALGVPGQDLAAALREAEVVIARDEPGADWASFRAIVP